MSLAQSLLDIHAIQLSPSKPFVWASGVESPIYCDNRITLSYPDIRSAIKEEFVQKIKRTYPKVQAIAGVATGGIAHGVLVADELNLPFVYVRDKPKGHGKQNTVEGTLDRGTQVVVIEDLISTGGSSLKAVESLREFGVEVIGLLAIFSYNFERAEQAFKEQKCPYSTLTDFKELLKIIESNHEFKKDEIESMKSWYEKGI